jgi:Cell wall-active antibiotics response 4TMS YvqF
MRENDAQHRATEFVKDLYAAGTIDAAQLDTGVAGLLAARTETELAAVMRSLPAPVALTSPDQRLTRPLEVQGGIGRLRLAGRWQIARQTHVSADLGSVRIDLTDAMFDDHVIDLHVYSGCGSITIIVPRGVAVQITHHKGRVDARLEPPVPGLPLIRLDVTTNIGTVHLRHPGAPSRTQRWPHFKRR